MLVAVRKAIPCGNVAQSEKCFAATTKSGIGFLHEPMPDFLFEGCHSSVASPPLGNTSLMYQPRYCLTSMACPTQLLGCWMLSKAQMVGAMSTTW